MKYKLLIVAVTLIILFLIGWSIKGAKPEQSISPTPSPQAETSMDYDLFATPEHLKNPDNHALSLEIIGPEGDNIFPAQARMYDAHIKGNAKYQMARIECGWKFYLNENNDEVLFREMNNSSILNEGEKDICGFTSTFIDKPGQLRVELTAELTTVAGEKLETVIAERSYLVAR